MIQLLIRTFIRDAKPTHLISLERPGKAENGHYHSMRGEQLDDMITDSALFLSAAREAGATVISIGDGGNEMGMGTFRREILAGVPHGELICTAEAADLTLASGVSNWWKRRGFRLCARRAASSCRRRRPDYERFALSDFSLAAAFSARSESRAGRLQRRPFRFRAADCAA